MAILSGRSGLEIKYRPAAQNPKRQHTVLAVRLWCHLEMVTLHTCVEIM